MVVELKLAGAPRTFSAERHGHGTQGALLFALYRLQVQWTLASSPPEASAVLTVEEPESHLHPTAQRAMAEEIHRLPGQVVATSHSPEFANSAKGRLALLRAVGGKTSIKAVDSQNTTVCLADADAQRDLDSFLKATLTVPGPTTPAEIVQALLDQDYFICEYGECLEQELARCASQYIDAAFQEYGEPTFDEWRKKHREQELGKNWKKKLGAERVGDMTADVDARAWRLSKWKEGPEQVARLMTNEGTDATLIPNRFKEALRRADVLARAQTGTP